MAKRSCYGCTAPKRHPGCHATCPDYERDNAEHQERKAIQNREVALKAGLDSERANVLAKVAKKRRRRWGNY